MKSSHAAFLALATFAAGLIAGQSESISFARTASVNDPPMTAATLSTSSTMSTALPAGHPAVTASGGLADAVNNTVRATGTPAAATGTGGNAQDRLVAQAESERRQRKFAEAAATYRKLIAQEAMTADTWADYADALASASSSLRGEPAAALDHALRLDPRHPKALWLKASLQHEEQQYAEAMQTWRTLLAVVPADSSDAKIIRANIDEAGRLARGRS